MKKILFVTNNLGGGGAEKVLIDILDKINYKKFDVTLILLQKQGIYFDKLNNNVKLKCIAPNNRLSILLQKIFIKYFTKIYYKLNIKEKFDVEIAFLEGMPTKFISNSYNKKSKKIAWVHCDLKNFHWTKRLFFKGEENKVYNQFDDIIFVSEDSKKSFNSLFNNKSNQKVIHNIILKDKIIKKANEFEVEKTKFTIVYCGRLLNVKGIDRLISAHLKLMNSFDYNIIIIGDGAEYNNLQSIIHKFNLAERVQLLGFKTNPYPYLKMADLIIIPSRSEGFSLVLAESLILNKCILSTNITGPRELLENGEIGILCSNTEEGIVKSLEKILSNKKIVNYYEEKLKNYKLSFDEDIVINSIEKLFNTKFK